MDFQIKPQVKPVLRYYNYVTIDLNVAAVQLVGSRQTAVIKYFDVIVISISYVQYIATALSLNHVCVDS